MLELTNWENHIKEPCIRRIFWKNLPPVSLQYQYFNGCFFLIIFFLDSYWSINAEQMEFQQSWVHAFESTSLPSLNPPFDNSFSVFPLLKLKYQSSGKRHRALQILCLRGRERCPRTLQNSSRDFAVLFLNAQSETGWFIYWLWRITGSQSSLAACRERELWKRTRNPLARSFRRWDPGVGAGSADSWLSYFRVSIRN